MSTKIFLFYVFLCCSQLAMAQQVLKGRVLDATTNAPLYFATVAIAGQPYGTLSEEDGSFSLSLPKELVSEANVTISYLGYETKTYPLAELADVADFRLKPVALDLAVISVRTTGDLSEVELGRKERKARTFYQDIFEQTYQLASRVNNPGQRPGVLTEVRYYFGKAAKQGKPVRLNFFAVDPGCDCPGAPLHGKSIIPSKNKSGWNKVDLTEHMVSLPAGDFFFAFEWLSLSITAAQRLNFSVGIVYDKEAAPMYEKVGGADWRVATERGAYRPLVRFKGKQ